MPELPLVSPLDRALFLRAQPYMAGLGPAILVVLASHCVERRFRDGESLTGGANGRPRIYFLAEGRVRTSMDGLAITDLAAPAGVGLAPLLSGSPASFELTAVGSTLALEIEFERFLQIMEDHFPVVLQLAHSLAGLTTDLERRLGVCPASADTAPADERFGTAPLDLVDRLFGARRTELFAGANLSVLADLLGGACEEHRRPDEPLWRAGEPALAFGLVVGGSVRLEDLAGVTRGRVGPDELIGLGDLFTEQPRAWSAVAASPVVALRIDRSHYLDVLEDHFDHARDLLALLAQRYLELLTANAEANPISAGGPTV